MMDLDTLDIAGSGANAQAMRAWSLGPNVLTVGAKGRFATIQDAFDYIDALPSVMDPVDVSAYTVDISQYSNSVLWSNSGNTGVKQLVQPYDLLWLDNDDNPNLSSPTYFDHYYPILIEGSQDSGVTFGRTTRLFSGVNRAQVGAACEVYRPHQYVIALQPGQVHDLAGAAVPWFARITLCGIAGMAQVTGSPLQMRMFSHLHMMNIMGIGTGLVEGHNETKAFPDFDEGYGVLRLTNVFASNAKHTSGAAAFMTSVTVCAFTADNYHVENIYDHGNLPLADYLRIRGMDVNNFDSTDSLALKGSSYRSISTHPKILSGLFMRRGPAQPDRGPPGMIRANISTIRGSEHYRFFLKDAVIIDENNDATAANTFDLSGPTTGTNKLQLHISNTVIDQNGNHLEDFKALNTNLELTLDNVKRRDGTPMTFTAASLTGTATIRRLDADAAETIAYAATVTPQAGRSSAFNIGTLTGNITIAAPTNPRTGQTIRFTFTQDATGARTITWNAVFKGPVVGPGTSNQKATFSFTYDGTNWVASGAAVWA